MRVETSEERRDIMHTSEQRTMHQRLLTRDRGSPPGTQPSQSNLTNRPMTFGSLLTPGYGGRVYFSTGKGFITMLVMPEPWLPAAK